MNRILSNFTNELTVFLKNVYLEYQNQNQTKSDIESSTKDKLKYYQRLVVEYFKQNIENSRGLLIWQQMGLGKTILAVALADQFIIENELNRGKSFKGIIVITPKALRSNFINTISKYNRLFGRDINPELFSFVNISISLQKQLSIIDEKSDKLLKIKLENVLSTIKSLNGYLVIVDEAHKLFQLISNGSKTGLNFYNLVMKSPKVKLIFLTGSAFSSSPFELVPCFNMLSSLPNIFPEDYETFAEYFYDEKFNPEQATPIEVNIKNKNLFQNRILGLVSYAARKYTFVNPTLSQSKSVKGKKDEIKDKIIIPQSTDKIEDKFPIELEKQVIRIPMSPHQFTAYILAREKELEEADKLARYKSSASVDRGKFSKNKTLGQTYRVRSRQYSNYVPSGKLLSQYNDILRMSANIRDKELYKFMMEIPPEDILSNKFDAIYKVIQERIGQLGNIYSNFAHLGGIGIFARYLENKKFTNILNEISINDLFHNLNVDSDNIDDILEKLSKKQRFAIIDGSLDSKILEKILMIYNHPKNKNGDYIQLLLMTISGALGLDLKNTRYGIMMEPYWVPMLEDQFKHRGIRYEADLDLPEKDRNYQLYVFLSVYPENIKLSPNLSKTTTDEDIYTMSMNHRYLDNQFYDMLKEVSIECHLLHELFPDDPDLQKIECKICLPNNSQLFTHDIDKNPYDTFITDMNSADPCSEKIEQEIEVSEITIFDENKNEIKLYYKKNPNTVSGYDIYSYNSKIDSYELLAEKNPLHKLLVEKLTTQKK